MYHNVHMPVTSLGKAPVKTSGLCKIKYFRWEDVLNWPKVDPQTAIMSTSIELKPGTFLYIADIVDQSRAYEEEEVKDEAGSHVDITVRGSLRGSNASNKLTIATMAFHQWGVIVEDRDGVNRLIGNQDTGADFSYKYSSGTINSSRKTEIIFKWKNPVSAPVYEADAFNIVIGGLAISAGCIQFIKRFEVGAPGAPMSHGDTIFVSPSIVNKKVLVLADSLALPVDDFSGDVDWSTSIQRHVEKANASNTITFVGGVVNQEIITIYAHT